MLSAAARMNITRDEAQARARLLDGRVVRRRRSTSPMGDVTFRSTTTARFRCTEPGAATFVDLVADQVDEIALNGRALDPRDGLRRHPHHARRPGARTTSCRAGDAAATCTPARACTGSSTRSTSPSTSTRSSRSPTRAGCSPSSSSPTSRRPSRSRSPRRPTGRSSPTSRRPEPEPVGLGNATWRFAPTERLLVVHHGARRRALPPRRRASTATATGSSRSALYCRASLAAHLDADVILEETRQGFEFFERDLRHALPVREVRPAVRAGVQLGRDGERRLRDAQRGLRLPVAGARGVLRAPGRDDPARDGAHVVRRPRDDDVVGRPVAQRVVRRVGQHAGRGRGDPVDVGLDDVRQHRQDLGLPAGPAALDAPDRRRDPRPRGRRGQLRRHHLRQGRVGAQAARGLGRARRVPRRHPASTSGPSPGATPPWPTCSASSRRPRAAT